MREKDNDYNELYRFTKWDNDIVVNRPLKMENLTQKIWNSLKCHVYPLVYIKKNSLSIMYLLIRCDFFLQYES